MEKTMSCCVVVVHYNWTERQLKVKLVIFSLNIFLFQSKFGDCFVSVYIISFVPGWKAVACWIKALKRGDVVCWKRVGAERARHQLWQSLLVMWLTWATTASSSKNKAKVFKIDVTAIHLYLLASWVWTSDFKKHGKNLPWMEMNKNLF